jgi:hypothetical protein
MIVLPGGGYAEHAVHEAEPIAAPVDLAGRAGHARLTIVLHLAHRRRPYVRPEHTYRLATVLAAGSVPHAVHVFAHGPHSLGLARGAGQTELWTTLAEAWIHEQA